jgi:hypothetical protein
VRLVLLYLWGSGGHLAGPHKEKAILGLGVRVIMRVRVAIMVWG